MKTTNLYKIAFVIKLYFTKFINI